MWMFQVSAGNQTFNLGLVVVDMQNGFVSKGGSYESFRNEYTGISKDYS